MEKKAVCLISGGMDSIVASSILKSKGYSIYILTFDYGPTPGKKEIECVKTLSKWICVPWYR